MSELPKVFKEIIEFDRLDPRKEKVVKFENIEEYVEKVREWKATRIRLSAGAARFIEKQKGN
jgi:hypothetical protein